MWRFLLLLVGLAAFSFAQQTVVITFAREGDSEYGTYNVIANNNSGFTIIQENNLCYTDESKVPYKITVAPVIQSSYINSFDGNTELIKATFENAPIGGVAVRSSTSTTMFKIFSLAAGNYTLSVLAASGASHTASTSDTFWITDESSDETPILNSKAEIISYNLQGAELSAPITNDDDTKVTAYTINTSGKKNTASNWVLMNFTFNLGTASDVALRASGTTGNIAAIKLSPAIPEPSTSAFLLITLTALITHRRRK